ncbi:MAG: hypothetical protein EpisKO_20480 [Epibacterium sp.]
MTMSMLESEVTEAWAEQYETAFVTYCNTGSEEALIEAYAFAREGLAASMSLADFGCLHHAAFFKLLEQSGPGSNLYERALDFYLEGVSVFDMAIHGYQNNVARLKEEVTERRRIEEDLRAATFELSRQRSDLDIQVRQRTAELRERAEELEQSNRLLLQTNKETSEFSYALSHDLKSPINTIGMLLDAIREELPPDSGSECADLVSDASLTAERMKRLIDDVLQYSQVVGDTLERELVDMNQLCHDALSDMRHAIDEAQADISCSHLPVVRGSAFQLAIMLRNFLSNALTYRDASRPLRVEISAGPTAETGRVLISIADNGIGMPPDCHARIFNLFTRLHTYSDFEGSGIGLALCKRVANNHNSDIEVESVEGQGTIFSFSIESEEVDTWH